MDPLTHGLLGAAASQALFATRLPRNAGLIGLVAGMAPDLDVLISSPTDPLIGWIYHRHFTHSLAFMPLGGLLASLPFLLLKPFKDARLPVIGAATLGYTTHGLLDSFTSYGTQLLWPFSDRRVAWDWMGIIDPLFTVILLVGAIWTLKTKRARAARLALLLAVAYLSFGAWQHYRATAVQRSLAQWRGHHIAYGRAMPAPGWLVLWRSLYMANGRLYVDGVRVPWWGSAMMQESGAVRLATLDEMSEEIATRPDVRRAFTVFAWFTDGFVVPVEGASANVIGDMRITTDWSGLVPLWGIEFSSDGVKRWNAPERERGEFVRRQWRALIYGDSDFRPITMYSEGSQ